MVLLYHTCYQNLPPVHKADIEFFAASFHPSSKEVLKQSEHVVLYQEKQNLLGLAVVSPEVNNVVDLTLIGVAHTKQKHGIGTEVLTYVIDELQRERSLRVRIPRRYNFQQLNSFFEKRDFAKTMMDETGAELVRKS